MLPSMLSRFGWSDFSQEVLVAPRLTPLIQQLHCYLEMLRRAVKMRWRNPQTYVCLPMASEGVQVSLFGEGFCISVQSDVLDTNWVIPPSTLAPDRISPLL